MREEFDPFQPGSLRSFFCSREISEIMTLAMMMNTCHPAVSLTLHPSETRGVRACQASAILLVLFACGHPEMTRIHTVLRTSHPMIKHSGRKFIMSQEPSHPMSLHHTVIKTEHAVTTSTARHPQPAVTSLINLGPESIHLPLFNSASTRSITHCRAITATVKTLLDTGVRETVAVKHLAGLA